MIRMTILYLAAVVAVSAIGAPQSRAQSPLEVCAADIGAYCSAVVPGNGRIAACLYAHEDKVSDACDAVMGDLADALDMFFETIRYVKQQCGADIRASCIGVERGHGRLFACLRERKASISAGCQEVLDTIPVPKGG